MASAFICEECPRVLACIVCDKKFPDTRPDGRRGRLPRFCSPEHRRLRYVGKKYGRPGYRAEHYARQQPKEYICAKCGDPFQSKQAMAKYCQKPECRAESNRASHLARSRDARLRNERTCRNCGKTFQKHHHAPGHYCSLKCTAEAMRKYADPADAKLAERARARVRKGIPELSMVQCGCGEMFMQINHRHLYHSVACREAAQRELARLKEMARYVRATMRCANIACGKTFSPVYGEKNRKFCSADCLKQKLDRVKQAARRSKEAGVYCEPGIDPLEIFERDGWQCYICGDRTPKELRGTRHQKAPELDHVIPIANGGPHTRDNVACCCKACNWKKGTGETESPVYLMPDWQQAG